MTTQVEITGIPSATEVHDDLRARGADYTPRPVARECTSVALPKVIKQAHDGLDDAPFEVLGVCSGAGVWEQVLVELWEKLGWPREWLRITAVEIDPREREHLERCADRVVTGDYTEALDRRYHLAIGNPNFDLLRAPARGTKLAELSAREAASIEAGRCPTARGADTLLVSDMIDAHNVGGEWYDVGRSMPARLLACCGAVALLHRQQAWSKDGPGVAVRRVHPPAFSWDIPGSLRFREPGARNPETGKLYGADQHNYSVSLWLPGHRGPTQTDILRDFSPAERRWTVRPGTER